MAAAPKAWTTNRAMMSASRLSDGASNRPAMEAKMVPMIQAQRRTDHGVGARHRHQVRVVDHAAHGDAQAHGAEEVVRAPPWRPTETIDHDDLVPADVDAQERGRCWCPGTGGS